MYRINMLYTVSLHNVICQKYFNKKTPHVLTGKKSLFWAREFGVYHVDHVAWTIQIIRYQNTWLFPSIERNNWSVLCMMLSFPPLNGTRHQILRIAYNLILPCVRQKVLADRRHRSATGFHFSDARRESIPRVKHSQLNPHFSANFSSPVRD